MSNLVLELRQGETMIVNGAPIRFRTKTRLELTARARFLFGKQIMSPAQADDERAGGLETARGLIAEYKTTTTSSLAREILDRSLAAAESDDCYQALKLVRRIIRHEDNVLGRDAATTFSPTSPGLAAAAE